MSLTHQNDDADGRAAGPGWRFVAAGVATRRTLALATAFVAGLGLLPLYEPVWWWDLLTHTLAGSVIAGWLLVARWRLAGVVLAVAVLSGAWEVIEYTTPTYVFVAGGPADTAVDVVCNFVGAAVAVAVAGFDRLRSSPDRADGRRSRSARRPESTAGPTDD